MWYATTLYNEPHCKNNHPRVVFPLYQCTRKHPFTLGRSGRRVTYPGSDLLFHGIFSWYHGFEWKASEDACCRFLGSSSS